MGVYIEGLNGWKGVMSLLIALGHFEAVYIGTQRYFATTYLTVEFFFIVSGFLLVKSLESRIEIHIFDEMKRRILRLFPLYLWGLVSFILLYAFQNKDYLREASWNIFLELLMLQQWGIGNNKLINPPGWYISSLILCVFFMVLLIKNYSAFFKKIVIPISIVFVYPTIINIGGNLDLHDKFYYIVNSGTIRGWADMCLGAALYYFSVQENKILFNKKVRFLVEFLMLFLLYKIFYKHSKSIFDIICIIPFSYLVIISYANKGISTKLISSKIFKFLGNISYSIYINHFFVIIFMKYFITGLNLKIGAFVFFILVIVYSTIIKYIFDKIQFSQLKKVFQ